MTSIKGWLIRAAATASVLGMALLPGSSASAASITVVATGLNNPRHLTIGQDGAIYVAESGKAGTDCTKTNEGTTCYGPTGAIVKIANGRMRRIITGLPSEGEQGGFAASGPTDVAFRASDNQNDQQAGLGPMYYTIGGGNRQDGGAAMLFDRLLRTAPGTNTRRVTDLQAYEYSVNPDGKQKDSNAYGLYADNDGEAIADAAGNDLVRVSRTGALSTLAVFPGVKTSYQGQPITAESVPTSVTRGPDGAYYVGELTGFPFPVGKARIWRVVPGRAPTIYAAGFTNIIDIKFDGHGNLFVLEITKNGLLNAESSNNPADFRGALIRVANNGRGPRTTVTTNLITPTGMAIAKDGSIYVSNYGIFSKQGQVVRVRR